MHSERKSGRRKSYLYRVSRKKGCLVERDYSDLLIHPCTKPYKLIDFDPKPCHPEAMGPVIYSKSLLSCMIRYKDASKCQSSLLPLITLFLGHPVLTDKSMAICHTEKSIASCHTYKRVVICCKHKIVLSEDLHYSHTTRSVF